MLASTPSSASAFGQALAGTPVAYTQRVCWEEYRNATSQTTTLTRSLSLRAAPLGRTGERLLALRAEAPQLYRQEGQRPLELEVTEDWALRLAALYAQVQGRVNAVGEWVEVLNHKAIAQAWVGLRAELLAENAPDEPLLTSLLTSVDQQVAAPGGMLRSLRYDYLYQALAGGWPVPPLLAEAWSVGRPRCFAAFLPGLDLWFTEQTQGAVAEVGQQKLVVRGTFDAGRTDLTALPSGEEPAAALPRADYAATVTLDAATSLPIRVEVCVSVRRGDFYNREYTLNLERA